MNFLEWKMFGFDNVLCLPRSIYSHICLKLLSHHYLYIWTALFVSCSAVVCGWFCVAWRKSACLPRWAPSLFYFCHNDIVYSLQLCCIEMHSLPYFNIYIAFDGGSEIQLMFCWLEKFFTGFSKYRRNFVSYGRKYGYMRKGFFLGFISWGCCHV